MRASQVRFVEITEGDFKIQIIIIIMFEMSQKKTFFKIWIK